MLRKAVPVLPAFNLRATIEFYESNLGFTGINLGNYAIIKAGLAEIHFYLITDKNKVQPVMCLVYADNVEDLYASLATKDLLYPPDQMAAMKFGKKEFSIKDNNGNLVRFSK